MYCFRCGKKLPPRVVSCPDCNTVQKKRQRYRRRLILGLFIFLSGAILGSLFDSFFFKGQAWEHSFLNLFDFNQSKNLQKTGQPSIKPDSNPATKFVSVDENGTQKIATYQTGIKPTPNLVTASTEQIQEKINAANLPAANTIATAAQATFTEAINESTSTQTTTINSKVEIEKTKQSGMLVYDNCTPINSGSGKNYHGFVSKDGKKIVFASNRLKVNGKNKYQCFIKKNKKGSVAKNLFRWPGNIWTPEFTPDNDKVIFSSDSKKEEHIFSYDITTKTSECLTTGTSKNMMPSISPDGNLIAFVSNRKGTNDIWIMGIDGKDLMQITNSKEDDREPRWWPDGTAIVFTRIYERLKKSYIMKVNLSPMGKPEPIIKDNSRNWLADVSPDASCIAYVRSEAKDGSKNRIHVRQLDSNKDVKLNLLGGAECFRPVWLKSADAIIFHANKNNKKGLYFANFKRELSH